MLEKLYYKLYPWLCALCLWLSTIAVFFIVIFFFAWDLKMCYKLRLWGLKVACIYQTARVWWENSWRYYTMGNKVSCNILGGLAPYLDWMLEYLAFGVYSFSSAVFARACCLNAFLKICVLKSVPDISCHFNYSVLLTEELLLQLRSFLCGLSRLSKIWHYNHIKVNSNQASCYMHLRSLCLHPVRPYDLSLFNNLPWIHTIQSIYTDLHSLKFTTWALNYDLPCRDFSL